MLTGLRAVASFLVGFLLMVLLEPAFGVHCFVCEDPKDLKCTKQEPFNCSKVSPIIGTCFTSVKGDENGTPIKIWRGCGSDASWRTECANKTDGVTECVCGLDLCNGFTPEIQGTWGISRLTKAAFGSVAVISMLVFLIIRTRARLSAMVRYKNIQRKSIYFI